MIDTLKNVTIGVLLIVIVAGGLYFYFVILPQQEFSESQEQTVDNAQEIERMEIEINTIKRDLGELRMQLGQPREESPSLSVTPEVTEPVPREATRAAQEEEEQEEQLTVEEARVAYEACFAERTENATSPDDFQQALEICQDETGYQN
jgi:hypothetical protein